MSPMQNIKLPSFDPPSPYVASHTMNSETVPNECLRFFSVATLFRPPLSSAVSRSIDIRGQIRGSVRDRGFAASGVVDACLVVVANVVKKFQRFRDKQLLNAQLRHKTAPLFSENIIILI